MVMSHRLPIHLPLSVTGFASTRVFQRHGSGGLTRFKFPTKKSVKDRPSTSVGSLPLIREQPGTSLNDYGRPVSDTVPLFFREEGEAKGNFSHKGEGITGLPKIFSSAFIRESRRKETW